MTSFGYSPNDHVPHLGRLPAKKYISFRALRELNHHPPRPQFGVEIHDLKVLSHCLAFSVSHSPLWVYPISWFHSNCLSPLPQATLADVWWVIRWSGSQRWKVLTSGCASGRSPRTKTSPSPCSETPTRRSTTTRWLRAPSTLFAVFQLAIFQFCITKDWFFILEDVAANGKRKPVAQGR